MHLVAFVVGGAIVGTVLWDAFETLVLPRTPRRRLRLTRLLYQASWTWWRHCARRLRSHDRRERFLALYGPASVFVLLTFWVFALVIGFALVQWSQREHLANMRGVPTFTDDLYVSATALFALGLSDVAPNGRAGRLLIVAETGSSLLLLSMLFSYIPTVYQSFARRELRITMLDAWAGSPPSATEILSRAAASGSLSQLDTFFADWEYWCSDLLESHLSYPAIGYFRSQHPHQSWVSALDAARCRDAREGRNRGSAVVAGASDVRRRASRGSGPCTRARHASATAQRPPAASRARSRPQRARTSRSPP